MYKTGALGELGDHEELSAFTSITFPVFREYPDTPGERVIQARFLYFEDAERFSNMMNSTMPQPRDYYS